MDITVAVSRRGVIKSRRTVEIDDSCATNRQDADAQNRDHSVKNPEWNEFLAKYRVGLIGSVLAVVPCFLGYWATAAIVYGLDTQLFSLVAFWIYGAPTIVLTGPLVVVAFWRLIENRMPLWIFSTTLIVSFLAPVGLFVRYAVEPEFKQFFISSSQSGLEHILLAQIAVLLAAFVPAVVFSFVTAQAVSRSKLSDQQFSAF